ncbi:hypothetical protein JYP52_10500 [Nitratireductor aquibiodomus]|uniref:hypothetical protein n=1 Tax=Nitratireductor aquibiodomus TaxID=204799 RepID=UPI0019D34010|nr:hypothetical protein [Nitratireductor aquibiodomus]MBN7761568.1 hypothetical protein [Nitratireductor aquibiodomus]
MSALASILLGVASELAVPVIKKILGDRLGGAGGDIADKVIDIIAEKAGVAPDRLPDVPAGELQDAIVAAEPNALRVPGTAVLRRTVRAALKVLTPPPELTISDLADANRRLSSEANAQPGLGRIPMRRWPWILRSQHPKDGPGWARSRWGAGSGLSLGWLHVTCDQTSMPDQL